EGRSPLRQHLRRRGGHPLPRWAQDGAQGRRFGIDRPCHRRGRLIDDETKSTRDRARYARQIMLVEIGEDGQSRLEGPTATVGGDGLAHEVAEAYARRAGIERIERGTIDGRLAPAFLENAAARAVVAGSRAALAVMRAALRMGGSTRTA